MACTIATVRQRRRRGRSAGRTLLPAAVSVLNAIGLVRSCEPFVHVRYVPAYVPEEVAVRRFVAEMAVHGVEVGVDGRYDGRSIAGLWRKV